MLSIIRSEANKSCRKCGRCKTLWFFPRDRSRPDGRWHSCRACNREYWKQRGKRLALDRKERDQALHLSRTGLQGLRQYRRKEAGEFDSLPEELRWPARQLLNKYLARHRHHLTGPRIAALCGLRRQQRPTAGRPLLGAPTLADQGLLPFAASKS